MAAPMNWEEAKDKLKQFREDNVRQSDEVVEIWETVLNDYSHKLGDELWLILEQVSVAACDCNRLTLAASCMSELSAQFPDSIRVKRLYGLLLEAREEYPKAEETYNDILEQDQTNSLVRKRMVVVLKAQNKIPEAIEALNKYLEHYMADYEAWQELCDLYLLELDYQKAAYCMEEVIASNPHNALFHQRYAEIKYTQGNQENVELARSYYSHALQLSPNNMRCLYGLFLCATSLASSPKSSSKSKKDNQKFGAWAAEQIAQRYKTKLNKEQKAQMDSLEHMLDSMQLSSGT